MSRDVAPLHTRLVEALPLLCGVGAVTMAGLGWALRRRLSPIDRTAFALDAVGYVAAVVPISRRHPTGWWTVTVLTAAQPLFSVAKLRDGTGGRGELVGRAVSTVAVLAGLAWVKPSYDAARSPRPRA